MWSFFSGMVRKKEVGGEAEGMKHGLSSMKGLELCCSQRTTDVVNVFK